MNSIVRVTVVAFLTTASAAGGPLHAGGPLLFDSNGPFSWSLAAPITYVVDTGPLGVFADTVPQRKVQNAFGKWAGATPVLTFTQTLLPENVKSAVRYLTLENDHGVGNVVVLDDQGDIVAQLAGPQNRDQILGWAQPLSGGRSIGRFVSLMNGALAAADAVIDSTMVHEFGHALGLDHAQINQDLANNGDTNDDQYLPTMFPTSTDDDSSLVELNPDDISWIRRLYPSPALGVQYGTIGGRLVRGPAAVLGANITAIRIQDENGRPVDQLMDRFSCVSDYLRTGDGGFELVVPAGVYRLRIEPINRRFTAGSSVGPHAEGVRSLSFVNPVRSITIAQQFTVRTGQMTSTGALNVQ